MQWNVEYKTQKIRKTVICHENLTMGNIVQKMQKVIFPGCFVADWTQARPCIFYY